MNKLKELKNWCYYEIYNTFIYYMWRNPKRILLNFWHFRKEIYNFRDFDYSYNFELFIKSLKLTAEGIKNRERISSYQDVSTEILRFIELYDSLTEKNTTYLEKVNCDFNKLLSPLDKENNNVVEYTPEEWKQLLENSNKLYKKDLDEYLNILSNFQDWWD